MTSQPVAATRPAAASAGPVVSPIERELIQGALESCIQEMRLLMDRTSMSPFIKEKKDYFVGLYSADGEMICARISNSGPRMVDAVLKYYPKESMRPGDVYWFNDPYLSEGAIQHSQDMCFVRPVFVDDRLVAFVFTYGHFWDIGGTRAGSISPDATEIFHEGTLVPPIRIIAEGKLNEEVYRVILRNSRFPEMLEGDTRAMLASCQLGERRLQEIFRRFGTDVVLTAFRQQLSRSEDVARRVFLSQVAPGKHTFKGFIDGDGRSNRTYKVQLDLIREGDRVIADFRESDDQAEGPINFIASLGVVQLMFARFVMAAEPSLPLNEGTLRVIDELRTRPGSILAPQFPAAVGVRAHAKQKTNSTVLGALATATGGQTPASSATYVLVYLRARDPRTGAAVLYVDGIGVGTGGRPFANGLDVIYSNNQKNYPAEFVDTSFPLRLERYGVHVDSGGPGKHRGGCGCVREIRILSDGATLATRMDNARFPAWGVNGGRAGRRGRITVNPGSSDEREIESLSEGNKLREGDLLRVETAGGGGWGDPLERDPRLVATDVANGFVSETAALADYGVVIDPVSLAIDEAATAAERWRQARPWQLFDLGVAEA